MRRTGMISLIFIFVLSAWSCENFYDDTDEYDEAIALVEKITVDTVFNATARISLHCFAPNPCWGFSRLVEKRDSNQIHVTVYRKAKRNQTCIQVVSSFTYTFDYTVDAPGSYTIKIYRTPTTTMDTTIVI